MNYIGVYISILILLALLFSCHLKNYFKISTNKFINIAIGRPDRTLPLKYNVISYSNRSSDNQIPCDIASQAQFPCNKLQTPCPSITINDLSDSELAVIYKVAYEQAGLELLNRTLKKTSAK